MQIKRGLGRGLESLIPPPIVRDGAEVAYSPSPHSVPIDSIVPNRLQPRTVFDEERIREMADSIREQGILQPLVVSPTQGGRFELIAGERRLRAARIAGLVDVPVVIKKVDDGGLLALSIVENVQREDLNPIEESRAYVELMQQFGYTQEEVAKKVGKSRASVANGVRLLGLPKLIQDDVACGRYSAGHARALLGVRGLHEQMKLRERLIREMPTVRDVEKMVQSGLSGGRRSSRRRVTLTPQITDIVEKMKVALGTKIELLPKGKGGKVVIEYYSAHDLDRIFKRIVR